MRSQQSIHRQDRRTRLCHRRTTRGVAAVEMALILPVFFMIILGIVEFGRAMMISQLVTNAARQGARLSILEGTTNSDVQTEINDFLSEAADVASTNITVTITITPAPGNPDPGNDLSFAQAQDLCKVRVQVPFNAVSYLPGKYLAGTSLSGFNAMRHE